MAGEQALENASPEAGQTAEDAHDAGQQEDPGAQGWISPVLRMITG